MSLELVGVLMHDEPRVYVSNHLPRMEELAGAKTRSVDVFETMGLETLKAGEHLYVRKYDDHIRMVGAIRNTKHCTNCHGGQPGDLLGAFAYHLRPEPGYREDP